MKFRLIIDKSRDEEVIVYAHEKKKLIDEIEKLVCENNFELTGFIDREAIKLNLAEVYCFISENNKVFAVCEKEKFLIKYRLYQLEEKLPENFVKINQSCIADIKKIKKFDASFEPEVLLIFSLIFIASFFAIWFIVYFCVRATSKEFNKKIEGR